VNVSTGRPPVFSSRQQDHRTDDRRGQNFKYLWLGISRDNLNNLKVHPHDVSGAFDTMHLASV
jgi:hypothetical protein